MQQIDKRLDIRALPFTNLPTPASKRMFPMSTTSYKISKAKLSARMWRTLRRLFINQVDQGFA